MPKSNDPAANRSDSESPERPHFAVITLPGVSESSSEDDDPVDPNAPPGYQPLAQDPTGHIPLQEEDREEDGREEDDDDENFPTNFADFSRSLNLNEPLDPNVQTMVRNAQAEQRKEESEERSKIFEAKANDNITMDEAKVDSIKSAMSKIKLPTPAWAKEMSQEEWDKMVQQRIRQQKS